MAGIAWINKLSDFKHWPTSTSVEKYHGYVIKEPKTFTIENATHIVAILNRVINTGTYVVIFA